MLESCKKDEVEELKLDWLQVLHLHNNPQLGASFSKHNCP